MTALRGRRLCGREEDLGGEKGELGGTGRLRR